jgi:hypothetical protein
MFFVLLVTISIAEKEKDHMISRRVNESVSTLFPYQDVGVSCFGGIAVLSGRVDRLKTKAEVDELVREDRRVGRVINKITGD